MFKESLHMINYFMKIWFCSCRFGSSNNKLGKNNSDYRYIFLQLNSTSYCFFYFSYLGIYQRFKTISEKDQYLKYLMIKALKRIRRMRIRSHPYLICLQDPDAFNRIPNPDPQHCPKVCPPAQHCIIFNLGKPWEVYAAPGAGQVSRGCHWRLLHRPSWLSNQVEIICSLAQSFFSVADPDPLDP